MRKWVIVTFILLATVGSVCAEVRYTVIDLVLYYSSIDG